MSSLLQYDDSIYTGVWTNWAHGRLLGATLTTTRTHGSLLIAFISLFVTIVGTRFWRIGCFIIHYIYSTSAPRDGLYHQRQAILRNAANGITGLWGFCEILYAWRKTAKSPYRRILPLLVFTLITLVTFALASTFSSRISSAAETQVLLSGSGCGKVSLVSKSVYDNVILYLGYAPYLSAAISSSANYAQQCYSEDFSEVGCGKFVRRNLRTKVNRSAACPFDPKICKSHGSNLLLDTGFIDSREDLGLNTPQHGRFLSRRLLHCAPLITEGYSRKERLPYANGSQEESVMQYFYGNTSNNNYTYQYPIGTSWVDLFDYAQDFTLQSRAARYIGGSWSDYSTFQPIDELKAEDSRVIIVFLSTNGVWFTTNSSDIWYSANSPYTDEGTDQLGFPLYQSFEPVSPLGCLEKSQLCNPNLPPGEDCTQFFSSSNSNTTSVLWPDKDDRKAAEWYYELTERAETSVSLVVDMLRESSLESRSQRADSFQGPIANNQWQLDVEKWFNISMARIQQLFIETATGIADPAVRELLSPPPNNRVRRLCKSQMIQSTAYTNFSVFGLAVVFIVGGLIIALSYVLEPLACWIQHRHGLDVYTRFEWTMNETLQLQRLAHEELGVGSWKRCDGNVPITEWRDQLAVIDLEDSAHPKLKPPPPMLEEVMLSTLAKGNTHRWERDEDGRLRSSSDCGAFVSAWDRAENVGPQIFTEDTVPLTQHT